MPRQLPPKCAWTGEWTDRAVPVEVAATDRFGRPAPPRTLHVSPEHEAELRAFAERARRYGRPFLLTMAGLTLAMVVVAVLGTADVLSESATAALIGLLTALVGLTIIVMPFATPETVGGLGVRASVRLARVVGVATIGLGVVIALLG